MGVTDVCQQSTDPNKRLRTSSAKSASEGHSQPEASSSYNQTDSSRLADDSCSRLHSISCPAHLPKNSRLANTICSNLHSNTHPAPQHDSSRLAETICSSLRSITCPAAVVRDADGSIELLDQSFSRLLVTASGRPVRLRGESLTAASDLLIGANIEGMGAEQPLTGTDWPLLPIVCPDGIQMHFVEPSVSASQRVSVQGPSHSGNRHPRATEE